MKLSERIDIHLKTMGMTPKQCNKLSEIAATLDLDIKMCVLSMFYERYFVLVFKLINIYSNKQNK